MLLHPQEPVSIERPRVRFLRLLRARVEEKENFGVFDIIWVAM
jgi:hypothetical protein